MNHRSPLKGSPRDSSSSRNALVETLYAVFATALAYLLYYRVLAMAGSGNLMICTLLIPPVAITLGVLILGEDLALRAYVGFGILTIGLIILDGRLPARLARRLRP